MLKTNILFIGILFSGLVSAAELTCMMQSSIGKKTGVVINVDATFADKKVNLKDLRITEYQPLKTKISLEDLRRLKVDSAQLKKELLSSKATVIPLLKDRTVLSADKSGNWNGLEAVMALKRLYPTTTYWVGEIRECLAGKEAAWIQARLLFAGGKSGPVKSGECLCK